MCYELIIDICFVSAHIVADFDAMFVKLVANVHIVFVSFETYVEKLLLLLLIRIQLHLYSYYFIVENICHVLNLLQHGFLVTFEFFACFRVLHHSRFHH